MDTLKVELLEVQVFSKNRMAQGSSSKKDAAGSSIQHLAQAY